MLHGRKVGHGENVALITVAPILSEDRLTYLLCTVSMLLFISDHCHMLFTIPRPQICDSPHILPQMCLRDVDSR